mmetsp:Transcript_6613/g.12758  ORF Transcript_6613/g.12758 Transcript_6613/m.12758 type:complete len:253 (-) Transcript_6613:50-808(-)
MARERRRRVGFWFWVWVWVWAGAGAVAGDGDEAGSRGEERDSVSVGEARARESFFASSFSLSRSKSSPFSSSTVSSSAAVATTKTAPPAASTYGKPSPYRSISVATAAPVAAAANDACDDKANFSATLAATLAPLGSASSMNRQRPWLAREAESKRVTEEVGDEPSKDPFEGVVRGIGYNNGRDDKIHSRIDRRKLRAVETRGKAISSPFKCCACEAGINVDFDGFLCEIKRFRRRGVAFEDVHNDERGTGW